MKSVIIDANNLLHKIPKFRQLHSKDKHAAAVALRDFVKSRYVTKAKLLFVFDGHGEKVYSDMRYSASKSADDIIREEIEKYSDVHDLTVISSDNGITGLARVCGCTVISSEEFCSTLEGDRTKPLKEKNVNEVFEKPDRSTRKEIEEFKKYFT